MQPYQIAKNYSINQKINIRANALFYFEHNQYCQLQDNRLILAPYYNDRLINQGKYIAYINSIPQYVKDMESH